MLELLIFIILAIIVVVVLFIALDYIASAVGGDGRLWMLIKGLIVLAALLYVLQRQGVV